MGYQRSEYPSNRLAGRSANADNGWGGYQWPQGVPARLLGRVEFPGGAAVTVRKELTGLVLLMAQIADVKYGRRFRKADTGAYNNRPIGNTDHPSNHSRARAIDFDWLSNMQGKKFQCDLPPGLIADWQEMGFGWGGYYGTPDPMHAEYAFTPADVARHVAAGAQILNAALGAVTPNAPTPTPTAPAPAGDWFDMATEADLEAVLRRIVNEDETAGGSLKAAVLAMANKSATQLGYAWATPAADGVSPAERQAMNDAATEVSVSQGYAGAADFGALTRALVPAIATELGARGGTSLPTAQIQDAVAAAFAKAAGAVKTA